MDRQIDKGKAGVPVELGVRVAIGKDQHGLILYHRVMENSTDDRIAMPLITQTRARFPEVESASLDKGFHSPANQAGLAETVPLPVVPKKAKRTRAETARERDPEFIRPRRRHSAGEIAVCACSAHRKVCGSFVKRH